MAESSQIILRSLGMQRPSHTLGVTHKQFGFYLYQLLVLAFPRLPLLETLSLGFF